MISLKKKTNLFFYSICGIGLIFTAIFILLNNFLYRRILLTWSSILGKIETICGCTNHFTYSAHPFLFITLILTGFGILSFLIFAFIKLIKIKIATDRFIKRNLKTKKLDLSPKLEKASKFLKLENRVVEIKNQNIVIFCYGFFKQKICVSSNFVAKLSHKELVAVLLHEQYHLNAYETTRIFIVKVVTTILFFIPGLKSLTKQYLTYSELAADEWAINNSKNKLPLARAVYKALKHKEANSSTQDLAISYFSNDIIGERIKRIVDDKYRVNFNYFNFKFLLNLVLVVSFLTVFSLFVYSSKPLLAGYEDGGCSMDNNLLEQCQMVFTEPCQMDYAMQSADVVCPSDNI